MNTDDKLAWMKFCAIIEEHGKRNNSPEWRAAGGPLPASMRTLPAIQPPAPCPQYERQ